MSTEGYAGSVRRAVVAILYRAMKKESWVALCRQIRKLDEAIIERDKGFDAHAKLYFSCWQKLADFSDRLPAASEDDLVALLELSEITAFLRYVTESFEVPELVAAALEWFDELVEADAGAGS